MKRRIDNMAGAGGFTLVELLVVIAIITILATITVPNLIGYIDRSRVAATLSDVRNTETSLNGMLADASVTKFQDFFTKEARYVLERLDTMPDPHPITNLSPIDHEELIYQTIFYSLLRQGRDAALEENVAAVDIGLRDLLSGLPEIVGENDLGSPFYFAENTDPPPFNTVFDRTVTNKLRTSYMELGNDSWDQRFYFWMGPFDRGEAGSPVLLRSFRLNPTDPALAFIWDVATRDIVRAEELGVPQADDNTGQIADPAAPDVTAAGYPAPYDRPVYIWSSGLNELQDAHIDLRESTDPGYEGGGDDINNWDSEAGWESAPRPE